jgi:hypothetical protein
MFQSVSSAFCLLEIASDAEVESKMTDKKLDLFAGAVAGVLDHSDTIQLLLRDYFNAEAVKHLSDRRLLISEDVIRSEVMRIEETANLLKELHCRDDGIVIELQGKHRGAAVEAQILLYIRKLVLTESTQTLKVHVTEEKRPVGKNFLGKIVCCIGTAVIGNFTGYALKNCDLGEYTSYDDQEKLVTVRLNELPNVQRLLEPQIASWKDSVPLRLVGVEEAVHVEKGVEMHLSVSPALGLVREGLSPAVEAAKGVLSWFKGS